MVSASDVVLRGLGLLPCAVRKPGGLIFNPPPHTVLDGEDIFVVMGSPDQIARGIDVLTQKV